MRFDISRQEAELLGLAPKTKEHRKTRPIQEGQAKSRSGPNRKPQPEPPKDGQGKEEKEKATQAQILISLAGDAELFHTPDGECYATLPVGEHYENWPIKSKQFRRWLLRKFYESQGKPPGAQALQDALGVLEARAQFDGPELPVHVRLAGMDGKIYVDLCNEAWEAVEISPSGWRVAGAPPVKFRRTKGMLPLPAPEKGGSMDGLRRFVNVPDGAEWRLVAAWLLAALRPRGPYPILLLQGEQGSAKSTTARVLRSLVDPSTAPLRTAPREERDLAIAAGNSWLLAFDNVSGIPNWLSDALCRVATGGGFATRELYSNNEEALFDYMRPVVLNGIDDIATRHDLLDRCIIVNLPSIPEETRREEESLWQEFERARPWLFGALLDGVAAALRGIDKIKLDRLPRMADFAKWVTAAESSLPWRLGEFMAAYTGNQAEAVDLALEADVVATAVKALLGEQGVWEGTATELLAALEGYIPEQLKKSKAWPKTARALGNRLRRSATFLRQTGVQLESGREPGTGRRLIRISRETTVTNVTDVTDTVNTAVSGVTQNQGVTQTSSHGNLSSQRKGPDYGHCDNSDGSDAKKRTYSKTEDYGEPALWEGEI